MKNGYVFAGSPPLDLLFKTKAHSPALKRSTTAKIIKKEVKHGGQI
jgi:hypothetical protein